MAIRDKSRGGTPGQELKHFTDRENDLATFQRLLALEEPAHLPALMFFGVGGTGKSWLRKRLRNALDEELSIPWAYIDFDRQSGGPSYVSDFSNLLAEVWRQLDVECPRFEAAYSWMTFKQGAADRPLIRNSGKISTAWDLVKEAANAGFSWVPGVNLIVWATDRLGKAAVSKIEKTSLGKHLLTSAGHEDYLRLSRMTAQEIYPTLTKRLGEDLDEQLPKRAGKRCRVVVFLDTFEDLAGGEQNEARRQLAEEPVRELYMHLTCVLLVMFGRDPLTWDKVNPDWGNRANLEQDLLGGLSRHDAIEFLGKCGVEPGPLLEAILRVSRDAQAPGQEAYPFALGLCADTVMAERNRGIEPKPDTFDMAPGDYSKLAQRFLKSLHDEHPERWIIRLAQTPRFDEAAARAAFSPTRNVHQDKAWESLPDYSFVQDDAERGWFRIHSVMSGVLRRQLAGEAKEFALAHKDWRAYWQSRAQCDTDEFAALAWYHDHVLDPQQALSTWNDQAEKARGERDMTSHLALLDWWAPTEIEQRASKTPAEANVLICLGAELSEATLGNRTSNLHRAIACYEAALRVYTESDFPSDWATTQNNLGNAYSVLPTGDRDENLRRAIVHYEAVLRVRTESDFPSDWAGTQNNLGNAYSVLPTGDRGENLRRAVACYEAALRVYTESDFPSDWAATQNNLGSAYSDLPTGDRGENLRRAIACYESALRVWTESDFPSDWAMTQNNLGSAYWGHPAGDQGENLHRAIACYEAALRVQTESDFPSAWAGTQNNLGLAYSVLPTGDRDENLHRATACYEAALRVRTESDFPSDWARTQFNLGLALRVEGRLDESMRAFDCAARAFVSIGDESHAELAKTQTEESRRAKSLSTET